MKKIIEQYGGALAALAIIVAIVIVAKAIIGTDATGPLGKAISDVLASMSTSMAFM